MPDTGERRANNEHERADQGARSDREAEPGELEEVEGGAEMTINMFVTRYDRKPNFEPDYEKEHHGTITGNSPAECMSKLNAIKESHDLAKYTRIEIVSIY